MAPVKEKSLGTSPSAVRFFIAEDIRQEINNKVSLFGLYTDSILVVNLPDDAQVSSEKPLVLEGIAVLVTVSRPAGTYKVSGQLEGSPVAGEEPRTIPIFPEETIELPIGGSANLICRIKPFVTQSFGMKTVRMFVDGVPFEFPFEVRDGRQLLPQTQEIKKAVKKGRAGTSKKSAQ